MSAQSERLSVGDPGAMGRPPAVALRRLPRSLAPVIVLGVLAAVRLPWLHSVPVTQDEAIILVYAQQILEGRLPHRDFYTVYGPGTFTLTAGAFALLGSNLVVERIVGLALQAIVVMGIYRLARGRGRPTAVGASLLSVLCLAPLGLTAYAWVGGLGCIVWGLALLQGHRPRMGYALLALTAVFRPEMTVAALVAGLPFLTSRSALRAFAVGFGAGLAPSAAYYATWGRQALGNAVLERGFVNAKHEFDGVVVVILGLTVCMIAVLAHTVWRRRRAEGLSWATLVAFLLPQLIQRTDLDHFSYVAAVAAPLVFLALGEARVTASAIRTRRLVLVLAIAGLVVPWRLGSSSPDSVAYEVPGRSIRVEPQDVQRLEGLREATLRLAPANAKVFVGTQDMSLPAVTPVELYFLFPELQAEAYYLELPIGISPTVGRRIADDVRNADVLLLSRFPEEVARRLNPYVPPGPADADEAVRAGFCPAGGSKDLRIMIRCATAQSGPSQEFPVLAPEHRTYVRDALELGHERVAAVDRVLARRRGACDPAEGPGITDGRPVVVRSAVRDTGGLVQQRSSSSTGETLDLRPRQVP